MISRAQNLCRSTAKCGRFALFVCAATLCSDLIFISSSGAEAVPGKKESSRYLIIVDTSLSMQRRSANVQKVVGDLMVSGMNGQLRPGDTIGVWTCNENLNAGSFPLQVWAPQRRQRIAAGVVEFLQSQRFEKKTQLEKALAPMTQVVKASDKITVLLISDGDDKVNGTPFDNEINETYQLNYTEQRKLRMPFVTVLRARKGEFIGGKVSVPPWPVEFPEFPVEPKVAEPPVAETPPAKEEPKPQFTVTSTVPSLVVTGKKRESLPSLPTNAVATETARPGPTPAPAPVQPAEAPKPEPSLAATTALATNPIVKSAEPVVTSPTQPAESPPAAITSATQEQAAVLPSAPAKSEASPRPKPADTVPRADATAPHPAESVPTPSSPQVAPAPGPTSPAPSETPVVQTAVATPSETIFNRTVILIGAIVLLLVALGLVYALTRRSRTTADASLITRSMDQDKK